MLECERDHLKETITCMLHLNHDLTFKQGIDILMEAHVALHANHEYFREEIANLEKNDINLEIHFQELMRGITKYRHVFFHAHLVFVKAIDEVAIPRMNLKNPTHHTLLKVLRACHAYKTYLLSPISQADNMKINEITKTYDILRALTDFSPLCGKLFEIQESLLPFIPKNYSTLKEVYCHIEVLKKMYSSKLDFLKSYMMGTLNYLFKPESFDLIYSQMNSYKPNPATYGSLFQPSRSCQPASESDVEGMIQFFKTNLEFFIAPFDTNQSFQDWAIANAEELTPFSDGILKILSTKDHMTEFKHALIQLKEGNENRFKRFLKHPSIDTTPGFSLREFLTLHMNNPIFEKWYKDNPPASVKMRLN